MCGSQYHVTFAATWTRLGPEGTTVITVESLWAEGVKHHHAGRVADASDCYRRILSIAPHHHAAMNNLGAALAATGALDAARGYLEQSVALYSESDNYWLNFGCFLEMTNEIDAATNCFEKARSINPSNLRATIELAKLALRRAAYSSILELLEPLADRYPDHLDVLDYLVIGYHHLDRVNERDQLAEHSMRVRDRLARAHLQSIEFRPRPTPATPSASTRKRNIIAFSLWGNASRYVNGALDNVLLAAQCFPNWQVRFYCESGVSSNVIAALSASGADVILRNDPLSSWAGLFWRFEPISDCSLDRVLVRDADCRLGAREAAAVEEWIASGECFHIMRDHPCNNELILAGLWGGICGVLHGFPEAAAAYQLPTLNRWSDQLFLRLEVWPVIASHALMHDSHHHIFGARSFPNHSLLNSEPPYVGASFLGADPTTVIQPNVRGTDVPEAHPVPFESLPAVAHKIIGSSPVNLLGTGVEAINPYRLKRCRRGTMIFNRNDLYIGDVLDYHGEYSEAELDVLLQLVKPGDTIVEVGANIGCFSVPLAQAILPDGELVAFEPQRLSFQLLCANLALNSLWNVHARHAAVGQFAGKIPVPSLKPTVKQNFGSLSLSDSKSGELTAVETIDAWGLTSCRLIKVDVQGMEREVLIGGKNTIERLRPILYVENDVRERSAALISLLIDFGYCLWWHLPRLCNSHGYTGEKVELYPGVVSQNMLAIHRTVTVNIGLRGVCSVDDWPLSKGP